MKLYILRHTKAENRIGGQDRQERQLTTSGKKQANQIAKFISKKWIKIDCIFSSPYVRTLETAQIIHHQLDRNTPLQEVDWLTIDENSERKLDFVIREAMPDINACNWDVLLVGHEPNISRLIAQITGGSIKVRKGALVCIELEYHTNSLSGKLCWMITPDLVE